MLRHLLLYFIGMRDCVKCHFCNGGLKNWLPGDDPWVEHARWFPGCPYVISIKGKSFVACIQSGGNVSLNNCLLHIICAR